MALLALGQSPPDNQAFPTKAIVFHPVLFAAYPLLALYARNASEFPVQQLLRPLTASIGAALVVWILGAKFLSNSRKAAIVSSAAVLSFLSSGHIANLVTYNLRWAVSPLLFLLVTLLVTALAKNKSPLSDLTKVLNFAAIALVLPSASFVGAQVFYQYFDKAAVWDQRTKRIVDKPNFVPNTSTTRKIVPSQRTDQPDIYYVILDAYGREDSLKKFLNYDNSDFIIALKKRGFYVAPKSRANYDQTPICLASSLNMNYLDALTKLPDDQDTEPCRRLLDDNQVAHELSKHGYQYDYIWSGAGQTRVDTADRIMSGGESLSTLESNIVSLTSVASQAEAPRYTAHREYINNAFRELNNAAILKSPKFVLTHIISPHPPFVFGPNGEEVSPKGALNLSDGSWLLKQIGSEQYAKGYVDQLKYINKQTLTAIDSILAKSHIRPIIIIQGDHGSRMNLDWESESKTEMREAFSILNAYYVPPKMQSRLYDTISPVNTFRILLNQQFEANYKILPDRSYYSGSDHPFVFKDVTDRCGPRL